MRDEESARNCDSEETSDVQNERDGHGMTRFLLGVGVGLGLALLFAPRSGEETRRWLVETADDRYRRLRRRSRRGVVDTQDLLDRGGRHVSRVRCRGERGLG